MKKVDFTTLQSNVITRTDIRYDDYRKGWNRSINKFPLAFAICKSEDEIVNAISWAKENNIPIRIRAGRHNYEGFSSGDDVLVIDVSSMKGIFINEEEEKVTIEAGVLNEELYESLAKVSYAFPGGACPTVGVVGFTLGGGWGYSSRKYGLGCDSLLELTLIDYEGKVIIANDINNRDLFWACKGAGAGNFGVITKMTYRLPGKIGNVTVINGDTKECTEDEIVYFIQNWQNGFETLSGDFNGKISIYSSLQNQIGIKFVALYHGKKYEAIEILDKIGVNSDNMDYVLEETSFIEALRKIQYSHPESEKYKSGGRFVYKNYDEIEIKKFIDIIQNKEQGAYYAAITLYGLGGAVLDKIIDDTAFYHRNAKFILGIQAVWNEDIYAEKNRKWVEEKFNFIKLLTKGSFINFPLLEQENYLEEYYGKFEKRLKVVKQKYDPLGIFTFEQGI